MKNKKKIILAAVGLLVLAAVLLGVYFATRPAAETGAKGFTVAVQHGNGQEKTFSYRTDSEYLGEVLQAKGLISGEMGEWGLYVKAVDGETADYDTDGAYWEIYINGEYAMTGVDVTPIHDGDVYTFKYASASE